MSGASCPYGGQWWTCTDQSPSFQGCCSVDPCQGNNAGCPDVGKFLRADAGSTSSTRTTSRIRSKTTFASSTKSRSKTETTHTPSTTSSSSVASSSSTTTLSASSTSSSTSTPAPSSSSSLSKAQVRAIIGGSVGGAVLIFLIIALILTWYRAKKSRKAHVSQPPLHPAPSLLSEMSEPQSPLPRSRTPLPSLQTNLSNPPQRQRTQSTYSAYSPDQIRPNSFEFPSSVTDQLVGSVGHGAAHSNEEAYYPGRPIFGVLHAIKSPEAVAHSRMSTFSGPQVFNPLPADVSHRPSLTSPNSPRSPTAATTPTTADSRRASYNHSSPRPDGPGNTPSAAAGARTSQRRSSGPHYDSHPPPMPRMGSVQSDRNTAHEPRRRSEPPPINPIYETPDSVGEYFPELPS